MGVISAAALLWGFGEATLFFVVPDVLLTIVALTHRRAALVGCAWAVAGALVGGWLMYRWGASDSAAAMAALDAVPAVGPTMLAAVERGVAEHGLLSIFAGPITGTPYKIYAVVSGATGVPLGAFLAVSVPARGIRFLLLTLGASWVAERWLARWSPTRKRWLAAACWLAFYVVYFALKWD